MADEPKEEKKVTASQVATKITAQEAANIAAKYYQEVSHDATSRLQVSEVELSEDEKFWNITLSIASATDPLAFYGGRPDYKIFKIDAKTRKVISMKVRKIE